MTFDIEPAPSSPLPVPPASDPLPGLAVVVPVKNEAENVLPLLQEIDAALGPIVTYEVIYVDDGSSDDTPARLIEARRRFPQLRVVRHRRSCGQSQAVATGVKIARAPLIATIDGDCQNDPADIPKLLEVMHQEVQPDRLLVAGLRAKRRDTWVKRLSSRIANRVRSAMLGDATPDSGCGLKLFSRAAFLDLPRFDHMHRFLPALMIRAGGRVVSVPVNHRQRDRGQSNYGTWDRLRVGLVDLLGVWWLQRRASRPVIDLDQP